MGGRFAPIHHGWSLPQVTSPPPAGLAGAFPSSARRGKTMLAFMCVHLWLDPDACDLKQIAPTFTAYEVGIG